MDSLRGNLLIAGPSLWDPNFRRTIVLLGEHDEDGALGVVLNRPTSTTVEEAVPALAALVPPGDLLFLGGPVQPQAAVVLAEFDDPERAGLLAFDGVGFLLGEIDPHDVRGLRRARVFAGYAGWGAGQLEAELEQASWVVERALPEDVFTGAPSRLWPSVLRRKGGKFALMATMPVDPSTN